MIVVRYELGRVMWEPGPILTYLPIEQDAGERAGAEQARLAALFAKPALVPESTSPAKGAIADGYREEAPGSADHARAVMRSLADAVIEIDEDG